MTSVLFTPGRCVPRDMGAPAAARLRATLLEIAEQEERFAWSASGGML